MISKLTEVCKKRRLMIFIAGLIFAGLIFFLLRWYQERLAVSATTSAYRIDLPEEVKKTDLPRLTDNQKKLIDKHVADVLKEATKNREQTREVVRPVAVILTQDNQPIIDNQQTAPVVSLSPTEAPSKLTPTQSPPPPPLSPSPTIKPSPTPTNAPNVVEICTDSDNGKNYNVKGISDYQRYENGELKRSSHGVDDCVRGQIKGVWKDGYLREYFCIDNKRQDHKLYDCPYGCFDGACQQPAVSPSPTKTPTAVLTVAPENRQIRFNISLLASQLYQQKNNANLSEDINKIYQEAQKIYGPPFRDIDVSVEVGSGFYYNVTLNSIVFHQNQVPGRQDLIWLVLLAFHDDLINYMPQNWEDPLREIATAEIYRNLFDPTYFDSQLNLPLWRLIDGEGLANKNGDLYAQDRFTEVDYFALAVTTLYKPYLEDNQFIAKFNQAVYRQPIDNQLPGRLNDLAAGLIPSVNGENSRSFFWNHYILRTTSTAGGILNAQVYNNQVVLTARLTQGQPNQPRSGKGGANIAFRAWDVNRNSVFNQQITTDSNGVAQLGAMPTVAAYSGSINFFITVSNSFGVNFWYPYFNGKPVIPGGEGGGGVFGAIANKKTGYAKISYGPSTTINLTNGAFVLGAGDYRGLVKLEYLNDARQSEKTLNFTKNYGPYFIDLNLPNLATTPSSPPQTRAGSRSDSADCAKDWQEYESSQLKFKLKYPSDWSQDPVYSKIEPLFERITFISTLNSADQLDPKKKVSHIEVVGYNLDLKQEEDYKRLFDNATGTQTKTQVTFKGLPAEKYLDDVTMPAGSYHIEMYYFQKDGLYYLINAGFYTTPDVKEKNEATLRCFLENFALTAPSQTSTEVLKCSQGMFGVKSESQCQTPPFNQPVCGHNRLIYDNGARQDQRQTYDNVCAYCGFFDHQGKQVLRGTTIYSLGYTEGRCQP